MVQMKVMLHEQKLLFKHLYIPHGSDESDGVKEIYLILIYLYIPHGSDESSPVRDFLLVCYLPLYPTWFR